MFLLLQQLQQQNASTQRLGPGAQPAGPPGAPLCGSILLLKLLKQQKHKQMHMKSLSLSAQSYLFRPVGYHGGVGSGRSSKTMVPRSHPPMVAYLGRLPWGSEIPSGIPMVAYPVYMGDFNEHLCQPKSKVTPFSQSQSLAGSQISLIGNSSNVV